MAVQLFEDLWELFIPLPNNPLKNLNAYLVTGDEGSLLIDTGFRLPECMEALEAELKAIGVDRDKMDIFITHLHADHIGLAPEIIRPGRKIYFGSIDKAVQAGVSGNDRWHYIYNVYLHEGFPKEEMDFVLKNTQARNAAPIPYDGYICIEDGFTFSCGKRHFQCIHTPGHTPGHLCLYEPEAKWLFSGDHILFHITPNITRWPEVEDSLGDYLKSLDKIAGVEIGTIFPAHRQDRGDAYARIEELKMHHQARLDSVLAILQKEPGLSAYETAARMKWSIRARDWADFPTNQKFFAVGEAMSHLDHLVMSGKVRREDTDLVRYYLCE